MPEQYPEAQYGGGLVSRPTDDVLKWLVVNTHIVHLQINLSTNGISRHTPKVESFLTDGLLKLIALG